MPERIDALTRHPLYDSQATAETAMREAEEITKMEWAKVVAATAEKLARDPATTPKGQWLTTGITVAALVVLAAVGAGYALGKNAGPATGPGGVPGQERIGGVVAVMALALQQDVAVFQKEIDRGQTEDTH